MAEYRCLTQQTFTQGSYALVPIRMDDRWDIRRWRNEQIYHLRQAKPLSEQDQDNYFKNVVAKLFEQELPGQILMSLLKDGHLIGYGGLVHINWTDRNAEVSFLIDTQLEREHFAECWATYLQLLPQLAFGELRLHKIYTYAFDIRPQLYPVLEANGFRREATLAEHCLFEGEYKDVVIHSMINSND